MSGTSLDGLDACLVQETLDGSRIEVIQSHASAFSQAIQEGLARIIQTGQASLPDLVRLEAEYTDVVIEQCLQLIQTSPGPISVIGFHGQTLWHDPEVGSTLQIGFAERLAEKTGVPVVHQFRRGDMARGGQGAPPRRPGGLAAPLWPFLNISTPALLGEECTGESLLRVNYKL